MRVAVITPAFNAAVTIADTLRSVLAQTHANWRMAVVDDGSTDATAALATACADPRICVVRQPHTGVSAARNRGLAVLDADAFLFLDADDRLAPWALTRLAWTLAADPGAVAATGGACFVDARGGPGTRRRLAPIDGDALPGLLIRNRYANGGHLLLRASAVRAAGGFRTDLTYGEDWEYWTRIATQGRFAAVRGAGPLLWVRERDDGAYRRQASDPAAMHRCLDAIFANPALRGRFPASRLARLRRRAEAEAAWVVGRALLWQGDGAGRRWLLRSVAAAPTLRRIALLAAAGIRVA